MKNIFLVFVYMGLGIFSDMSVYGQENVSCLQLGESGSPDVGNAIIQTSDGGFAMAGTSNFGVGITAAFVVKLDSSHQVLWRKTIGSAYNNEAWNLIETLDGGLLVCGNSEPAATVFFDMYAIKLDSLGNVEWTSSLGNASPFVEWGKDVVQTNDSGYVLTGYYKHSPVDFDLMILKLNSSGTPQWRRLIGGPNLERGNAIVQTADGGFLIAGDCDSYGAGGSDMYFVKTDSVGGLQWTKTAGGTTADVAYDLISTQDGGYAAVGATHSFGAGDIDVYMVKMDSLYSVEWSRTWGDENADQVFSIVQTADGGYAMGGYVMRTTVTSNIFILKTDGLGIVQWSNRLEGSEDNCLGYDIIECTDGGLAVTGQSYLSGSSGELFFVKTDGNGFSCCGAFSYSVLADTALSQISSGGAHIIVSAPVHTYNNHMESVGGVLTDDCSIYLSTHTENKNSTEGLVYPNPGTGIFTLKADIQNAHVAVFTTTGERVFICPLQRGTIEMDLRMHPNGMYFYTITSSEGTNMFSGKIILQR